MLSVGRHSAIFRTLGQFDLRAALAQQAGFLPWQATVSDLVVWNYGSPEPSWGGQMAVSDYPLSSSSALPASWPISPAEPKAKLNSEHMATPGGVGRSDRSGGKLVCLEPFENS